MHPSVYTPHPNKKRSGASRTRNLFILLLVLIALTVFWPRVVTFLGAPAPAVRQTDAGSSTAGPVLVSYSYFEKDPIQVSRLPGGQAARSRRRVVAPPPHSASRPSTACKACTRRLSRLASRLPAPLLCSARTSTFSSQ